MRAHGRPDARQLDLLVLGLLRVTSPECAPTSRPRRYLTAANGEWYGWFYRETRGHSGRRHVVRGVEGAGTRRQCISRGAPDNGASRRIPRVACGPSLTKQIAFRGA